MNVHMPAAAVSHAAQCLSCSAMVIEEKMAWCGLWRKIRQYMCFSLESGETVLHGWNVPAKVRLIPLERLWWLAGVLS